MSMAPDRQYLAVALKQGETVASKSRAKIVGAAGKTNGRVFASKFVIAATIMSLSAIWSFAICNVLIANLVLTHLVRSRTRNCDRVRTRGSIILARRPNPDRRAPCESSALRLLAAVLLLEERQLPLRVDDRLTQCHHPVSCRNVPLCRPFHPLNARAARARQQ